MTKLEIQSSKMFSNYFCMFINPNIFFQEQVKKAFCDQKLFWPFTVWKNCSSDFKNFANSLPPASNFKSFSRSLGQFFLTVGQNNFGNKIPFTDELCWVFPLKMQRMSFCESKDNDWPKSITVLKLHISMHYHFILVSLGRLYSNIIYCREPRICKESSKKFHLSWLCAVCAYWLSLISIAMSEKQLSWLERTYKHHYQNFSPLPNGTDLNRGKYSILQTHWH